MAVANVQPEYFKQPQGESSRPVSDSRRTQGSRVNVERRRGRRSGPVAATETNPWHETQDEAFSRRYDTTQRYTNPKNNRINRVERTYAPVNNQPTYQPSRVSQVRKRVNHKNKAAIKAKKRFARLRVTAINSWVTTWSITYFLAFQWWMGLISVVGLGMAYAVYAKFADATLSDGVFSFVVNRLFTFTANTAPEVIRFIADRFFGIGFDPMLIFLAPSAILLLLGLLQLLIVCFMYSAAGVKPLWGRHWGLKVFTFAIALMSSITPLPLTFLWLAVVWKNPK